MTFVKKLLFFLALTIISYSNFIKNDPVPLWNNLFTSQITEIFRSNYSSGTFWYDSINKRERIDKSNTFTDQICNSILPNKTTLCTNIYSNGKRYIMFPTQKICCKCCISEQKGCAMVQPNWLQNATYKGYIIKSWEVYDHWIMMDGQTKIDYYLCESSFARDLYRSFNNQTRALYFNTYNDSQIQDNIFSLPQYCKQNISCPKQSSCSKFAYHLSIQ